MRDYPLPCGRSEHFKDPQLIEQKLQEGKSGFVKFYLENYALIKNNQIPFIPTRDYAYEGGQIKSAIKGRGRILLHARLFHSFIKHYKIRGKIIYTDFWEFEEKKGCANKYLDHCDQLKEKQET